jgi:hypothetical protein
MNAPGMLLRQLTHTPQHQLLRSPTKAADDAASPPPLSPLHHGPATSVGTFWFVLLHHA